MSSRARRVAAKLGLVLTAPDGSGPASGPCLFDKPQWYRERFYILNGGMPLPGATFTCLRHGGEYELDGDGQGSTFMLLKNGAHCPGES